MRVAGRNGVRATKNGQALWVCTVGLHAQRHQSRLCRCVPLPLVQQWAAACTRARVEALARSVSVCGTVLAFQNAALGPLAGLSTMPSPLAGLSTMPSLPDPRPCSCHAAACCQPRHQNPHCRICDAAEPLVKEPSRNV